MKKLKNTHQNKTKVLGATILATAVLGALLAKKEDRKKFIIGGAVLGLIISPGVSSFVLEEKKS